MSETQYGREPVQIVEIKQPRCGLRYASLPCRAAIADEVLRENLILHSQDYVNAWWTKTNVLLTSGQTAPDGTATAFQVADNVTSGLHRILGTAISCTSGVTYTLSIYVKQVSGSLRAAVQIGNGTGPFPNGNNHRVVFNPGTAAIVSSGSSVTASAVSDVGNGWFRVSLSAVAAAAGTAQNNPLMLHNGSTVTYVGSGQSLILWGVQFEAGAGASTYKATTTTTVARLWGTGTQPCYNTYWTCQDRENYTETGSIAWRFMAPRAGVRPIYSESDGGNTIKTNPLYMLTSVSTSPSRINVAARRVGESPLGVRAQCSAQFQDAPFDDHVGDYYLSQRPFIGGNFWSKTIARNPFQPKWEMRVYEGYAGQAIDDMQVRFYPLDKIDGPDSSGRVTVRGVDPLQLTDKRRAQFPRVTDIKLPKAVDTIQTEIEVTGSVADVTANFGNTGSRRYIRIGSEIIEYTGYTGTAPDLTLTGCVRGALGTQSDVHGADDAAQRVGRYERIRLYRIAKDLIENHTPVGAGYIDNTQWEDEGGRFLPLFTATATIPSPEDVEKLLGELCRDGLFNVWWDERQQTIPLLAVRPPQEAPVVINDDLNILKDQSEIKAEPDIRVTRVSMFYKLVNPLSQLTDPLNYTRRDIHIAAEYELPQSTGGEVRELTIYSRWIRTEAQALIVAAQILLRYREIPRYLTVSLDAKDRAIKIGDVLDVTTKTVTDVNGRQVQTRWQAISFEETKPGDTIRLDLQTYQFFGRFGRWMENDAPDYNSATPEERASGAFWADANGKMPDGTDGYNWQ